MDIASFKASIAQDAPPAKLDLALQALWWDAKGDWKEAHEHAQQDEGNPRCDWVHAYLHRKEGDASNARYWYRQAGRPAASGPLEQEWSDIVQTLIDGPLISAQKKS
jgi:hypothetical protein